jgi:selenium-binding protein 1
MTNDHSALRSRRFTAAHLRTATALVLLTATAVPVLADEPCQSPYMAKITGEEEFVYVWTLGVKDLGDGSDKLVTIDVRKNSPTFGKVIDSDSVAGRHEAHHGGFTDDRRQYWLAGLDTSKIFIFDVATDPANPRLVKTIDDFMEKSGGVVGPHGAYALPGRMLISGLSNKDKSGRTALVEYTNDGDYIATYWMPTKDDPQGAENGEKAVGYGYDARVLPRRNVMLSSSFTGWHNYMRPLGELVNDADAMKAFGNTMVLWDFHARKPRQVFEVPGAPLEVRWAWGEDHNYAFTTTALTSKIWLVSEDKDGKWSAKPVGDVGEPAKLPLPVDLSLSADDSTLFVDSCMDGMTRVYDGSKPQNPRQI